ncbi:MAG: hypothetical protein AAF843_07475 [Bacteroidota bacterium]
MKKFKSFQSFTDEVSKDDSLRAELISDPEAALNRVKIEDKWVYRMAIWFLGIVVMIVVVGTLFVYKEGDTPEFLIALASTAMGAIAGLISQNS